MLILSRTVGQSVLIGDGIQVTVLDVCENATRLGVSAPPEIPIHRKEMYDRLLATEDTPESFAGMNPKSPRTDKRLRAPMLILVRRIGQSILIGDDIEVTLIRYGQADDVSLGIEAPRDVMIKRAEKSQSHATAPGPVGHRESLDVTKQNLSGYHHHSHSLDLHEEIDLMPMVRLRITSIGEQDVSLSIAAPRRIRIHRGELTRGATNPHLAGMRAQYDAPTRDPDKIGTLVITRRIGESITIDNDTIVIVQEMTPQQVRIEICTNKETPGYGPKPRNLLVRSEGQTAKKNSNAGAAQSLADHTTHSEHKL